jgi:acyl-CoA dehydrogenase
MNIEQARLLTLKTAWMMDTTDPKEARIWISMIKTCRTQHGIEGH